MRHPALDFVSFRLMRQMVIWALAIALPVNSMSAVLTLVLGAQHRHTSSEPEGAASWSLRPIIGAIVGDEAMSLIDTYHARESALRLAAAPQHAEVAQHAHHTHDPSRHVHAHNAFERHVHDPSDGSVIALGSHDTGSDAAHSSGSLDIGNSCPIPAAQMAAAFVPDHATTVWLDRALSTWCSHVSAPLERPPCC